MREHPNLKRLAALVAMAALAAVAAVSVALADDISNSVDASVDAVAEVMPLTVGGANGTTALYVTPRNGDGKNGCNLTGSTTLGLSISSSNTAVATVSPSSVTFGSCSDVRTLTVTPVSQGTATISVDQTSNNTGGTFNLAPATFTVNVAPPPNMAPSVTVAGVTGGASYNKGAVPSASCQVTDAEDGDSSFPAMLSAVTGPYASDGIGAQTASCSYTDGGGLTVEASETYGIVDPSPPSISFQLSGTEGDNGWYTSSVEVDWTVTDKESAITSSSGCTDPTVSTDGVHSLTCTATSSGGTSSKTAEFKIDKNAPVIQCDAADGNWHGSNLSIGCTATDGGSGVSPASDGSFSLSTSVSAGTETTNALTGTQTVSDAAGNTATAGPIGGNKIDMKAPSVSCSSADSDWHGNNVSISCTASDSGAGLKDPSDASFSLSTTVADGADDSNASTGSRTVLDAVDNSSVAGPIGGNKVDRKNPSVSCDMPPTFTLGQSPANVTGTATDGGSGPASATVSKAADTSSVGSKSVSLDASDAVGNSSSVNCSYSVAFGFSGLFAPIDRPSTLNLSKAGQAIPLKWRLTDANGDPATTLSSVKVLVSDLACASGMSVDQVEEYAAGSSGLQNLGDGYYQFNWKSPTTYANSCKNLKLDLGEGSARTVAYIQFKK